MRVLILEESVGSLAAVLIELPIMLTASWFVCRWLIARNSVPENLIRRLVMGGAAFFLLMAFEFGVAVFGYGLTPVAYAGTFREAASMLGLLGQLAFAFFPVIQLFVISNGSNRGDA